jgi:N-carbamoyl-L-amino-acid hydrolase
VRGPTIDLESQFVELFTTLAAIGRHADGHGCTRLAWTAADLAARRWFTDVAQLRGLDVETDRNGNMWAWWGDRTADVVVTGSHLDTVVAGGAYDGALGVVSALTAVTELRERGVRTGPRALAVVAFADEEGARFNTPTFGSGLLTGRRDPADVLARQDADGVTVAEAMASAGLDPQRAGADPARLERVRAVVELHIEQGRHLVDVGHPLALCSGIWPRGRWRVRIDGEANHAGTTALDHRADPMLVLATAVGAARSRARQRDARATIGRIAVTPNGASSGAGSATAGLDARAGDDAGLDGLLDDWWTDVRDAAGAHGCEASLHTDSRGAATSFDTEIRERLRRRLEPRHPGIPAIASAAGHDAAVLAPHIPAAMLFVRNPTGVSHSPAERAETADCVAGVVALTDVLEELIDA